MKNNTLIVGEAFYSLQGEGRAIGTPCVFLRLGGCNLNCIWCDSVEVWKKGKLTAFENVLSEEHIEKLNAGAHLVITGGEPMLHQKAVIEYLEYIGNNYFVEVETNGTIMPSYDMLTRVQWWNVSPKLKNSNEPAIKRINEKVISTLASFNSIFKFVITKEEEMLEIAQDYSIPSEKLFLMPAGENRQELDLVRINVVQIALKYCVRYSDRLHVVIWDKKTGV